MAKTTSKAVAKKATDDVMAVDFDFAADSGGGMEHTDRDSFAIPFLRVLQKISPQCDEADAAYIEGAKGGMLLNTVTGKLYDEVIFLPCAYQRRFIQWAPRGGDGGYRGEWLQDDVARMRASGEVTEEDGKLFLGEANEKKSDRLVDTRSHYGLVIDPEDGSVTQVILSLSSTQIKKSKQLMSMLSSARVKTKDGLITPPTWMNRVRITTVLESNDQGSWYGVKFEADGFLTDAELYAAGKSFHDTVMAGEARAAYDREEHRAEKF